MSEPEPNDLGLVADVREEILNHLPITAWFPLALSSKFFFLHKRRPCFSFRVLISQICWEALPGNLWFFLEALQEFGLFWELMATPARLGHHDFVSQFLEFHFSKPDLIKKELFDKIRQSPFILELSRFEK